MTFSGHFCRRLSSNEGWGEGNGSLNFIWSWYEALTICSSDELSSKESGITRPLLFYSPILFYIETGKKTYRKVGIGTFLNTRIDLRPSLLQSRCASLGLSVSPRRPPMYVTSFSAYTTGSNRTSSPWTLSTCSLPIAERTLKPSESIAASLDATTFCLRLSRQLTCLMSSSGSVISSRRSVKRERWTDEWMKR